MGEAVGYSGKGLFPGRKPCLCEQAPGSRVWGLLAIFGRRRALRVNARHTASWQVSCLKDTYENSYCLCSGPSIPRDSKADNSIRSSFAAINDTWFTHWGFLLSVALLKWLCPLTLTPQNLVLEDRVLMFCRLIATFKTMLLLSPAPWKYMQHLCQHPFALSVADTYLTSD